jgi:hypothetical protein
MQDRWEELGKAWGLSLGEMEAFRDHRVLKSLLKMLSNRRLEHLNRLLVVEPGDLLVVRERVREVQDLWELVHEAREELEKGVE